ncbi:MAG: K+/H+ antiporter subunit F [Deltaproteobacteria bacterium]|nr:K+/H+ antiporter subunit F [Deltaproteobacteria bacterium]
MTLGILAASLGVLALSAVLVLVRAWRGPDVFDRALASETLTLIVVATLLLATDLGVDAALGLALFSFVGTAMLGYFLGRGEFPHE